MTDRGRAALVNATIAAREAGLRQVSRFHLLSAVVAGGGVATNVVFNLGGDLSGLPKVNAVRPGPLDTAHRLPLDPELLRVLARGKLIAEAWHARNLIAPMYGTDAVLLALLEECPKLGDVLRVTRGAAFSEVCRLLGWDEQVALVRITDREVEVALEEARRESSSPGQ